MYVEEMMSTVVFEVCMKIQELNYLHKTFGSIGRIFEGLTVDWIFLWELNGF